MILDIRVTVGSVKLLIKVWLRQKERYGKKISGSRKKVVK